MAGPIIDPAHFIYFYFFLYFLLYFLAGIIIEPGNFSILFLKQRRHSCQNVHSDDSILGRFRPSHAIESRQSSSFDGWERPPQLHEFVGLYSDQIEPTSEQVSQRVRFADNATMELATWVDRERVMRIEELERGQSNHINFWKPRVECDSERHAEARRWCDVDISRRYQTCKEFAKKRRYIQSNQGEYRPTRRQWQNRCSNHVHTRWTIKGYALGSIISNCTVLRSTSEDAKYVDPVRYGDEGKNSRRFVSNEQIPLSVRDHIGRITDETRQQLELKSAAHVASATKVNN